MFLICPFDTTHCIEPPKMAFHLTKCRKNMTNNKFLRCPFNGTHMIDEKVMGVRKKYSYIHSLINMLLKCLFLSGPHPPMPKQNLIRGLQDGYGGVWPRNRCWSAASRHRKYRRELGHRMLKLYIADLKIILSDKMHVNLYWKISSHDSVVSWKYSRYIILIEMCFREDFDLIWI